MANTKKNTLTITTIKLRWYRLRLHTSSNSSGVDGSFIRQILIRAILEYEYQTYLKRLPSNITHPGDFEKTPTRKIRAGARLKKRTLWLGVEQGYHFGNFAFAVGFAIGHFVNGGLLQHGFGISKGTGTHAGGIVAGLQLVNHALLGRH